jgi:hypothetical protein
MSPFRFVTRDGISRRALNPLVRFGKGASQMVGTAMLTETRAQNEMTCVCCNCQRERTDGDEWCAHTARPGERVTHGICPDCLYELYPDIAPLVRPR